MREDAELAIAHIDADRHIPLGQLPARVGELDADRGVTIACLCHHGMRSAQAAAFLTKHGFATLNITGGIDAHSLAVDPSIPRY